MTNRQSSIVLALALVASIAVGCSHKGEQAAEGQAAVSRGVGPERAVINQPVGPLPGPGDIMPVANPLGSDPTVLQEGRNLFVQFNCAGCHGGRAGGGMGPSLRDPVWLYGGTADRIFNSIAQGRGHGMPGWGARIPEKQLWELTAYVQSLRTPEEPERPQ